jgi:hypothetical protein
MSDAGTAQGDGEAGLEGRAPRIGSGVLAGLLGIGVCVLCILPPLIHWVSGPLGPLIGGFTAGARIKAKGAEAGIIGLTMGIGLGLVVGTIVFVASSFSGGGRTSPALIAAAGGAALVYASALGSFGAWFAGRS